eukprot:2715172-Karenia_brevis.AAC.1
MHFPGQGAKGRHSPAGEGAHPKGGQLNVRPQAYKNSLNFQGIGIQGAGDGDTLTSPQQLGPTQPQGDYPSLGAKGSDDPGCE